MTTGTLERRTTAGVRAESLLTTPSIRALAPLVSSGARFVTDLDLPENERGLAATQWRGGPDIPLRPPADDDPREIDLPPLQLNLAEKDGEASDAASPPGA